MEVGVHVVNAGSWASHESLVALGTRAESLDFDSLWVLTRSLFRVGSIPTFPIARLAGTPSTGFRTRSRPLRRAFHIGGYAAAGGSSTGRPRSSEANVGYHTREVAANSRFSVRVRTCRRR